MRAGSKGDGVLVLLPLSGIGHIFSDFISDLLIPTIESPASFAGGFGSIGGLIVVTQALSGLSLEGAMRAGSKGDGVFNGLIHCFVGNILRDSIFQSRIPTIKLVALVRNNLGCDGGVGVHLHIMLNLAVFSVLNSAVITLIVNNGAHRSANSRDGELQNDILTIGTGNGQRSGLVGGIIVLAIDHIAVFQCFFTVQRDLVGQSVGINGNTVLLFNTFNLCQCPVNLCFVTSNTGSIRSDIERADNFGHGVFNGRTAQGQTSNNIFSNVFEGVIQFLCIGGVISIGLSRFFGCNTIL